MKLTHSVILPVVLLFYSISVAGVEPGWELQVELGAIFQEKNTVQIPNDDEGTRFSLHELVGDGPWVSARVDLNWNINEKHGLRLVLAPFSYTESGQFDERVDFAGKTFRPDETVKASYRFDSWRLGYRYNFIDRNDWQLWVGGTIKVRDAEIKLQQGAISSSDDNLGVVPLLYLAGQYRINPRWVVQADFDGLAGGPGRAIDLSARVAYTPNDRWLIGVGYRGLEGGADTDDVYNFAWFNSIFASVGYKFR